MLQFKAGRNSSSTKFTYLPEIITQKALFSLDLVGVFYLLPTPTLDSLYKIHFIRPQSPCLAYKKQYRRLKCVLDQCRENQILHYFCIFLMYSEWCLISNIFLNNLFHLKFHSDFSFSFSSAQKLIVSKNSSQDWSFEIKSFRTTVHTKFKIEVFKWLHVLHEYKQLLLTEIILKQHSK